jgi:uncharacterized membrane protein YfcA
MPALAAGILFGWFSRFPQNSKDTRSGIMGLAVVAYSVVCVFLAAIVRGYSGFGFSLLAITALSLTLPPSEIVPSIFMLEVAASLHLLPGIWRDVHWRSLGPLILGCLIATPLGVYLLATVRPAPMQIALAVFVLAATVLLWRGFALKSMPGAIASTAAGAASGFANGAFGIGGPPVILFYFASPAGNIAGRASVIAFFLATDMIGLAFQSREGLVTWDAFIRALIFLPALLIGVWFGARSFKGADPAVFRKWVLAILAVLALLTAAKGFYALRA